jgi:hypothetical protein
MPQSIAIGLLVLGGVLLLVAVTGGKFKIFGAEVDSAVSSTPVRFLAGVLGVAFVLTSLTQNKLGGDSIGQTPASNPAASSSPASGSSAPASGLPSSSDPSGLQAPQSIPVITKSQPADSESNSTFDTPSASNSNPKSVTSANEFGIVFDPPSNVRVAPSAASGILCSVTSKTSIRILGSDGNWYQTDICDGRVGYIHRSQFKF